MYVDTDIACLETHSEALLLSVGVGPATLEDFASGIQWYTYLLTAWSCPR